jgi:ubiquinone/menaquinone biosynthesis C-methylase UbiE
MNLFDLISYQYAWFFKYQHNQFKKVVPYLLSSLSESPSSVLDVGCGTGAMCQVFLENGLIVSGCDRSSAMIRQSKRLTSSTITYVEADVLKGLPYPDHSFDLVVASFVAHGMTADSRLKLYAEMSRIARNDVLLIDYGPKRHLLTDFMEYLERGDYFNFIQVVDQELVSYFGNLTKRPLGNTTIGYHMRNEKKKSPHSG